MKTFVTIFPICTNVHLTKDVGQIPYFLKLKHNYQSKIVCYKNEESYPSLNTEANGLELEFIEKKGQISFLEKSVLKYIYKNAKSIDILNLYSFSKFTFIYGILYKIINPNGILFLKIDGYNQTFSTHKNVRHSQNPIKNFLFHLLETIFLKKVDLMVMENTVGVELVKAKFPKHAQKVKHLPVGVNDDFLSKEFNTNFKSFQEKENIILTVGRIGSEVKNHKMLLRAISKVNLRDWKLVFVGKVTDEFESYYKNWLKANPNYQHSIVFTGEIISRTELYNWYNKSKIFCMTSWNESFCCSLAESIYFGNYPIGTDGIVSMNDLTNHEKLGSIIKADDDIALSEKIQTLIDHPEIIENNFQDIISHSHKNFVWTEITAKLNNYFENLK